MLQQIPFRIFFFLTAAYLSLICKTITEQVDNMLTILLILHVHFYSSFIFLLIGCLDIVTILFRYKGGPPLPRKLISQVFFGKNFSIEVYPLCLKLIDSRDNTQSIIRISKKVLPIFYWYFSLTRLLNTHTHAYRQEIECGHAASSVFAAGRMWGPPGPPHRSSKILNHGAH